MLWERDQHFYAPSGFSEDKAFQAELVSLLTENTSSTAADLNNLLKNKPSDFNINDELGGIRAIFGDRHLPYSTPLFEATRHKRTELFDVLFDHGAVVDTNLVICTEIYWGTKSDIYHRFVTNATFIQSILQRYADTRVKDVLYPLRHLGSVLRESDSEIKAWLSEIFQGLAENEEELNLLWKFILPPGDFVDFEKAVEKYKKMWSRKGEDETSDTMKYFYYY